MIDLSKYDKFLIAGKNGLAIKEDCPENIKDELLQIDAEYYNLYGEHLIYSEKSTG